MCHSLCPTTCSVLWPIQCLLILWKRFMALCMNAKPSRNTSNSKLLHIPSLWLKRPSLNEIWSCWVVNNQDTHIMTLSPSFRHKHDPLAGPGNELEMSDLISDLNMKKMVIDYRSRQIQWIFLETSLIFNVHGDLLGCIRKKFVWMDACWFL